MLEEERVDSRNIISDYIFYSKYSRVKEDGTKESWEESISRVMQMHWSFFENKITEEKREAFLKVFNTAWSAYENRLILGSQRALQYGGEQLLKNHLRLYNCTSSYLNRVAFFEECMESLLSGEGTGYSVQKVHTEQLPVMKGVDSSKKVVFEIPDSIEGWARSVGMLIEHYYYNLPVIEFDYSQIRPEGSFISGGFKAPGPEPLKVCHSKIKTILDKVNNRKLRPFELHYITCIIADAVISGGIRRSAMIALFDIDDIEMLSCKTGNWFQMYPELCRCNNSAVIFEDTPKEEYLKIMKYVKEYGEPGIIFLSHPDQVLNPCCFSGDTLVAVADGRNAVSIKELSEEDEPFPLFYKSKSGKIKITNGIAFSRGFKKTIKVILSNGSSFECTEDHNLLTKDGRWVEAKDSLGLTLSKFFTTKSVKYRTINSFSDGHARQYRMLWEFLNGQKPEGYEIDHIDDDGGDFIDNLQLLSREDHLNKTSERRKGINNPNQIEKLTEEERVRRKLNSSINGTLEKNNNFKGLSNKDLIEIGKKVLSSGLLLTRKNCIELDSRFPLNFSKNRFDGSWSKFKKIVLGIEEYQEHIDHREIVEKSIEDKSYLKDDVSVIDIISLTEEKEVFDISVEAPEHNFIIITKGEENYLYSEGVVVHNCEVSMIPKYENEDGSIEYGWGYCNLCEINGARIKTEEEFYKACEAAAILGTFQAAYTDFPVLTNTSKKIAERDALIGVGITGMADNPTILFNETIQRNGAEIVKKTNQLVADIIGINPAARTTVIKPSGNASQLLGCGSGIHAYHFRKYIRNIQANNNEQALQEIQKVHPEIISKSFWNPKNESVISFPVELDENTMVRVDFSTIDFLKRIYSTKMNWIENGTNWDHPSTKKNPKIRMNVSCTVSVKDDEWEKVADWIWDHKKGFCGLSFLPESGDLDYPQAPYTSYLNEKELAETYGQGAILSSGLIVDGLQVFGDIWTACNAAQGRADNLLVFSDEYLLAFIKKHLENGKLLVNIDGIHISDVNAISSYLQHKVDMRKDWVRRFKKFAINYFNGNEQLCANCLKHVNIFHTWQKIKNKKSIEWQSVRWEHEIRDAGSDVATACMGGKCSI